MIYELFKLVFDPKKPKDLVACSLVNKRWQSLYSTFKMTRLAVINYPKELRDGHSLYKWSYPDRKIESRELCTPEAFDRLAGQLLLSNLKYFSLHINWHFEHEAIWGKLKKFSQLVHLEIHIDAYYYYKFQNSVYKFTFPKLKVLAIYINVPFLLKMNCPELSKLIYREQKGKSTLCLKRPETIKELDTDMSGPKLVPFKNVECLKTSVFENISKSTLLSLPRLKELHYDGGYNECNTGILGTAELDRMKRIVKKFLKDVSLLKGAEFTFRFAGFLLPKTELDAIDFGEDNEEGKVRFSFDMQDAYVYMKNYELYDSGSMEFIRQVNYSLLCTAGKIPSCFSKKFTGVVHVMVSRHVKNTDHLLCFLKSLDWLRRLDLFYTRLGQEFYEQLPAYARSLLSLFVREHEKLQFSFDFIPNVSSLLRLNILSDLSFESLTSLMRLLDKFPEGSLKFRCQNGTYFIITKRGCSEAFEVCGHAEFKAENLDELLKLFQAKASVESIFESELGCFIRQTYNL